MKKLVLIMVMAVLVCGSAFAEGDFLAFINDQVIQTLDLKQGIAYSVIDHKLNYLSTAKIVEKDKIALEIGYAGSRAESGHKIVGVVSYDLLSLKDYVDIPILSEIVNIRAGIYGGYGRLTGSNEWDAGASLTLISFKK